MPLKKFIIATVAGSMISTAALALSQDTIDQLASELGAAGYTKIEITDFGNRYKVEATGPNGKLERYYNADGTIRREEHKSGGDDAHDDDDYDDDYDDDDDDDRDDDRDDDHDDDDDDDRDDDRGDDDDDDHDDDHDDDDD